MHIITHIKKNIPWEWKYYAKRWIGGFSFDKKEFDKTAQYILSQVKRNKLISHKASRLPKKKLKIIFSIHQFFPKHYSGTERYLLNIATEMQKMGHDITIVTYDPNPEQTNNLKSFYQKKYSYQGLKVISIHSPLQKTNDSLLEENTDIRDFYSKLLKKEKPDVFHIIHPMYAIEGFWVAKKLKIKTVMTLTDYWMLCKNTFLIRKDHLPCFGPKGGKECMNKCFYGKQMKLRYEKAVKVLTSVESIICASRFVKEIFKYNGIDTKNFTIINHGYDLPKSTKIKHQKKVFTFGYTGSLLPYKGAHLLIQAFKALRNPDIRLLIYGNQEGDKEYAGYIKRLIKGDDRIKLMGQYSSKDIGLIHSQLDCVVVPSVVFETFSLTGAAAIAHSVPIIAPDISGTNEMIKRSNGTIFQFNSKKDLSIKMRLFYTMNKRVQNYFRHLFTVKNEADNTLNLYR